jgi:mycothiol synthase
MIIRPFTPQDYPQVAQLISTVWPEYSITAETLHYLETRDPPYMCRGRLLAFSEQGQLLAQASYSHMMGMYHPQNFAVNIEVHPDFRGQSIAQQLYPLLMEQLRQNNAAILVCSTREDQLAGRHLLEKWGFEPSKSYWESRLDLNGFDFAPFEAYESPAGLEGLEISNLARLRETDPLFLPRLHDCYNEVRHDIPQPLPHSPVSLEEFGQIVLENPHLLPQAYLIARDLQTDQYVGLSTLWREDDPGYLQNGMTGVRRAYRRRGLALAMKLTNLRWAQSQGVAEIRTGNESNNLPMLAINERLGFVKQPAWTEYLRHLDQA